MELILGKTQDCKNHWEQIRSLGQRTIKESVALGGKLIELKEEVGHGSWLSTCDEIGISQQQSSRLMRAFLQSSLNEIEGSTIKELIGEPPSKSLRGSDVVKDIDPFKHWSDEERQLKDTWESGKTIVINMSSHKNLLKHANNLGQFLKIDRGTNWGNPFELNKDGNRDEVCDWYEQHYWPYKKSLYERVKTLKGKVLGCHCYPERCHGNHLIRLAHED